MTIAEIQAAVAERYGVTVAELRSPVRDRRLVRPRHVAMYLARTLTEQSLTQIGRAFGGRDHVTVKKAVERVGAAITDADAVRGLSA